MPSGNASLRSGILLENNPLTFSIKKSVYLKNNNNPILNINENIITLVKENSSIKGE